MPKEDRDFVFELIDLLDEYENRRLIEGPRPEAVGQ